MAGRRKAPRRTSRRTNQASTVARWAVRAMRMGTFTNRTPKSQRPNK